MLSKINNYERILIIRMSKQVKIQFHGEWRWFQVNWMKNKKVTSLRVWPNIQGDRAMFSEVLRPVPDLVEQKHLYPLKAYIKRNKKSSGHT